MSKIPFSVDLRDVDLDSLNSEEEFRNEARRLFPSVVEQIAASSAEGSWSAAQREFKKIPGFKLNKSAAEKAKFVKEAAKTFKLDPVGRKKTENAIIDRLKELKAQRGCPGEK